MQIIDYDDKKEILRYLESFSIPKEDTLRSIKSGNDLLRLRLKPPKWAKENKFLLRLRIRPTTVYQNLRASNRKFTKLRI